VGCGGWRGFDGFEFAFGAVGGVVVVGVVVVRAVVFPGPGFLRGAARGRGFADFDEGGGVACSTAAGIF